MKEPSVNRKWDIVNIRNVIYVALQEALYACVCVYTHIYIYIYTTVALFFPSKSEKKKQRVIHNSRGVQRCPLSVGKCFYLHLWVTHSLLTAKPRQVTEYSGTKARNSICIWDVTAQKGLNSLFLKILLP